MPDAIFADPRLARLYDAFDGARDDLAAYVRIADALGARRVLDVGCGTGSLAVLLAATGRAVTAVDPAAASLAIARTKPGADAVTWVLGDAATPAARHGGFDLATMTGNVAQVFLTDTQWTAALRGIRRILAVGGHLAFETRRPEARAWEEWASRRPVVRDVPGVGTVEQRLEVTDVCLPLVSFRLTYTFATDGAVVTSDSTLRFRTRDEIGTDLAVAGFTTVDVRDAPDRPGHEYVVVARRS